MGDPDPRTLEGAGAGAGQTVPPGQPEPLGAEAHFSGPQWKWDADEMAKQWEEFLTGKGHTQVTGKKISANKVEVTGNTKDEKPFSLQFEKTDTGMKISCDNKAVLYEVGLQLLTEHPNSKLVFVGPNSPAELEEF